MHPSFKALLAYQDQQLGRKREVKVARHLSGCSRCRSCVAQMEAERQAVDSLLLSQASVEPPPFSKVFETIRVTVAQNRMVENHRPHVWSAFLQRIFRTPLVGFAIAVLLLMSFNTVIFTGLLLHPLYAVPAPTLVPVIMACMVPAYLAARRAARRLAYTHKAL